VNYRWTGILLCIPAMMLLSTSTVVGDENDDKDKPVVIESDKTNGKRILFLNKSADETGTNIVIEAVVENDEEAGEKQKKENRKTITRRTNGRLVVIDGDGKKIEIMIDGNGAKWPGLLNIVKGELDEEFKFRPELGKAIADFMPSRFLIGVHCEPVTDLLRLHLGLEGKVGLAVMHVVDDSPAAKAGLEKHDIITRLGESNVGSIGDLIAAVEKIETKEAELRYIRRGERKTTNITPVEREEIEKQFSIAVSADVDGPLDLQTLKKGIVSIAPGLRLQAGSQLSKAIEQAAKASQQAGFAKRYALERTKAARDMQQKNKSLEGKVEKLSQLVEKMQKDLQRLVEQSQSKKDGDKE